MDFYTELANGWFDLDMVWAYVELGALSADKRKALPPRAEKHGSYPPYRNKRHY